MKTKWISVKDRLPDKEIDGDKVLIYRVMNESQKAMAISIIDTKMVKYSAPDSFWTHLPEPPTARHYLLPKQP